MYDMNNLKKLKQFDTLAPAAWKAFRDFDQAAMADGAVSAKTKELIALGVALTTQCPYCLEIHTKRAQGRWLLASGDCRDHPGRRGIACWRRCHAWNALPRMRFNPGILHKLCQSGGSFRTRAPAASMIHERRCRRDVRQGFADGPRASGEDQG